MPNLHNYYHSHWPIKSIVKPSIFGIREYTHLRAQEAHMADSTRSICGALPCGIHIIDYPHDQGGFGSIVRHYCLRSITSLLSIWVVEYHIFIESNSASLYKTKNGLEEKNPIIQNSVFLWRKNIPHIHRNFKISHSMCLKVAVNSQWHTKDNIPCISAFYQCNLF